MLFRKELNLIRVVLGGGIGVALYLAHRDPCTRPYKSCLHQMLVAQLCCGAMPARDADPLYRQISTHVPEAKDDPWQ